MMNDQGLLFLIVTSKRNLLALLRTPQPAPPQTVLAQLANDLMSREAADFTLFLDDYHVVTAEAIRHALAAPDVERVADLIEQHDYSFGLHGQAQTMLGWLKRLPDALLLTRPRLCIIHATVLLFSNQLEWRIDSFEYMFLKS